VPSGDVKVAAGEVKVAAGEVKVAAGDIEVVVMGRTMTVSTTNVPQAIIGLRTIIIDGNNVAVT